MADPNEEIDRLYDLPLEDFVAERDALAKRLRADRRRDEAAAVKALRKPSVAAWAANQVLRSQPAQRNALLEAGDALREAQEDLLAGRGDAAAARAAGEAERRAVAVLVTAARGLAHAGGFPSDTVLDRVRETLHSAATDEEARAEVEAARLSRERRPAAFAGLDGMPVAPRQKRTKGGKPAPAKREEKRPEPDERKAAERERRRAAQAELKDARAAERAAGRLRREAEGAVHEAERDLSAARRRLENAEKAEQEAAQRREAAERAV